MKKSYVTYINAMIASLLLGCGLVQAATLQEGSVYIMKILPAGDPAEVGQCSAFFFGDISAGGCSGGLSDNQVLGGPALSGGDGISGDSLAGTLIIETGTADALGIITFTMLDYQMDPYLETPGGIFKTTMTPPDGSQSGNGTLDAAGNMTLSHTGRTGVAEFFESSIGIKPWNIDDSSWPAIPTTGLYEGFTTASDSNFDHNTGALNLTLSGRAIGDANGDEILDAVLVSLGNLGQSWGPFDGAPYAEAFNVQFELVPTVVPISIDIKPGSNTNPVNLRSQGKVTVAILTTDDFDAGTVDVSTINFAAGAAQPVSYGFEDVDSDMDWDLVLHFNNQETGIVCGETEASLSGQTIDGNEIIGTDSVTTVGCR